VADNEFVTGIDRQIRALELLGSKTQATMNDKMLTLANAILIRAKQLVPVDTGVLKASGEVVKRGGRGLQRYTVRFTAPYAIYVHENLSARHAHGKEAKFLEKSVIEKVADFARRYGKNDKEITTYVEVK